MGYTRTTASVYGSSLAMASAIMRHIDAEDSYALDPGPLAFARVRQSADALVVAMLNALNPLDAGGRRIFAEAHSRAAQIEDELGAVSEGF